MPGWWYSEKDRKIGPVAIEEIGRLLTAGKIDSNTMVWQEPFKRCLMTTPIHSLRGFRRLYGEPLSNESI
jgi:hypothetical protein